MAVSNMTSSNKLHACK